jgi:transposase
VSAADRIAELEALVERLFARLERVEADHAELQRENAELRRENAELRRENVALKAKVAELEEKLAKSSRNSSKPPSSDGPKARHERPAKKPTGRGPGGQPGHSKHERPEVPPEKVSKRVVLKPKHCERCTSALSGNDPDPHRHQVFELPKIEPVVTEYEQHTLGCKRCGHTTRAPMPADVPTRIFGPSVEAACGYFMGVHRIGKRGTAEILEDVFGLPISIGAVVDSQNEVSRALEEPYAEALAHAQAAPIKNADETSWREGNMKGRANAWLWTLVTSSVIVFMIHRSRAQDAAAKLLLNGKTALKSLVFGYLGTDRHGAYNFWPLALRQFCWSHLQRDFTAISERPGQARVLGNKLLDETSRMFQWWHRVRDGTLSRETFKVYMRPLRARVEALLLEGSGLSEKKTARTCAKLLKSSAAMWTFVRVERLEPTNNSAERAVRHGVIFRKVSGGTKSPEGSRFVERMLSIHATLRLQRRPILPFLRDACAARRRGDQAPSLLPTQVSKLPLIPPLRPAA